MGVAIDFSNNNNNNNDNDNDNDNDEGRNNNINNYNINDDDTIEDEIVEFSSSEDEISPWKKRRYTTGATNATPTDTSNTNNNNNSSINNRNNPYKIHRPWGDNNNNVKNDEVKRMIPETTEPENNKLKSKTRSKLGRSVVDHPLKSLSSSSLIPKSKRITKASASKSTATKSKSTLASY